MQGKTYTKIRRAKPSLMLQKFRCDIFRTGRQGAHYKRRTAAAAKPCVVITAPDPGQTDGLTMLAEQVPAQDINKK